MKAADGNKDLCFDSIAVISCTISWQTNVGISNHHKIKETKAEFSLLVYTSHVSHYICELPFLG